MPDPAAADFDPKGKGYLLSQHIAAKGYQAGSLLGLPVAAYSTYRHGFSLDRSLRSMGVTALAMTGVAGLMGAGLVYGKGLSQEGIEDRVYRLHHNEGQNRTDSYALYGGLAGLALLFGTPLGVVRTAGAISTGVAAGVLTHVATYRPSEQGPNKMLGVAKDLVTKDSE